MEITSNDNHNTKGKLLTIYIYNYTKSASLSTLCSTNKAY